MNTKIVNISKTKKYGKKSFKVDHETIYIFCGRPSALSNPYQIGVDGSREEVVEKYKNDENCQHQINEFIKYLKVQKPKTLILGCYCKNTDKELKGKKQLACHCDVPKERIDEEFNPTLF